MISIAFIGVGLGAGLVLIGAGIGIGWIGSSAVSGMSRQPEVAGKIQTGMIIAAALIEGIALFGLVIVLMAGLNINTDILSQFAKAKAGPAPVQHVMPE